MKTAFSTLAPPSTTTGGLRQRGWLLFRSNSFVAAAACTAAAGLFGLATIEEIGFWPCLPLALGLVVTVINLADHATRAFDQRRFVLWLGLLATTFGGAASLVYAFVVMLILGSYLVM